MLFRSSVDPEATIVRAARAANAATPERMVVRAEELLGSLDGLEVAVLGIAYRGGVKEAAFSGVYPTVESLITRGARVRVHDPLFSDEETRALGFTSYTIGDPVDVVVVQADHAQYRELGPDRFPGVRLLVDGRRMSDRSAWAGVPRYVVGEGGTA